jgi:hypothetical protein
MIHLSDNIGRTITLPTPPRICRRCLSDLGRWIDRPPIRAIFCAHAEAGAVWLPNQQKWIVVTPCSEEDFKTGIAAAIAAQTLAASSNAKKQ